MNSCVVVVLLVSLLINGSLAEENQVKKRGVYASGYGYGQEVTNSGVSGIPIVEEYANGGNGILIRERGLGSGTIANAELFTVAPVTAIVAPAPTVTRNTVRVVQQPVPYSVPQPVAVTVNQPIPYPIHVHVPVDRPVPVSVPQPYPVTVHKPYPVTVDRPVPVLVPHAVPVTVTRRVPVLIPQPYSVPQPYPVPVVQPHSVYTPILSVESSIPVSGVNGVITIAGGRYVSGIVGNYGGSFGTGLSYGASSYGGIASNIIPHPIKYGISKYNS